MKNRTRHNPLRTALAALAIFPLIAVAAGNDVTTGSTDAVTGNGSVSAPLQQDGLSAAAARGQKLVSDRSMGNCLACHTMKGSDVPSNVGPELANLKTRFPDPKQLYAIIYDEETRNPQTVMPPFGKNLILDSQQINDVIAFLYTE